MTDKTVPVAENKSDKSQKLPKSISGSESDEFTTTLVCQVIRAIYLMSDDEDDQKRKVDAAIHTMKNLSPINELDGMHVAQIIAVQNAVMDCYQKAAQRDVHPELKDKLLNQANKLSRTFVQLVESRNKYVGDNISEQRVTVQHVHVNEGGQAIVGNIKGGGMKKNEDNPMHPEK